MRAGALLLILSAVIGTGCARVEDRDTGPEQSYLYFDFTTPSDGPETLSGGATEPSSGIGGEHGRTLHIPAGGRLDYFLRLPPLGLFTFEEIRTQDENARFRVTAQRDGESEKVLLETVGAAGRQSAPIDGDGWPIVRLSLLNASAPGDGAASAGLDVIKPALLRFGPGRAQRPVRGGASGAGRPMPNVIIYLIDALRADHLGCYGYDRATSPHIDALAADGLRFGNAIAQAPWTGSAVGALFTGVYPATHGVLRHHHYLRSGLATLAEILSGKGFRTTAFLTNAIAGRPLGIGRGFSELVTLPSDLARESMHVLSDRLNARVFDWLEERRDDPRPFLLYVHSTDPHGPYTPPEADLAQFADREIDRSLGSLESLKKLAEGGSAPAPRTVHDLMALYDAEIAFNDRNFGIFVEELRRRGLYDDSLIVVLSDHGEEFYEHGGWQHMTALYDESLRIPLIMKFPVGVEAPAGVTPLLAQQVDVLPTVLGVLGIDVPGHVQGIDLLAAEAHGHSGDRPRRGFSQFERAERKGASIIDGRWKLIHITGQADGRESFELYDRARDPEERLNLAEERPIVRRYLEEPLASYQAGRPFREPGEPVIDDDLRRRLEALGYLD